MNFFVVVIAFMLGIFTAVTVAGNTLASFFDGIRDFLSGIAPPGPPF